MLCANVAMLHTPRLLSRNFKHLFGPWRKRNHLPNGHHATTGIDRIFNLFRQFIELNAHIFQNRNGHTLTLTDKSQQ